ncbi:asparagine synthase (glutamine-hydrolyzing) [candidate division CSSED10-310 bacterium]|uniref:asparagine synthase (glutamine-hydrolyzing) n=1 Tax=candidate division CSSED10-310 bacterium TaxID=2855610 RepID=A0ABV6YX62_UNCC1
MCGICGIFGKYSEEALRQMNQALIHRGPDSEGYYSGESCALGIRRLKIIDLAGSDQPIFNEDRSIVLVCNGEIYNYRSLRTMLVEKGHWFSTAGDVEVIVHLYEEYESDLLEHLHGMFAFALWDERKQQLFLARDRLGIKPLYWSEQPGCFLFASEIRSFLASGMINKELDERALYNFAGHPSIPAPLTIFKGIQALLPGHYMLVKGNGIQKIREYWDVDYQQASRQPLAAHEASDIILDKLTEAVKIRLISDVPLGAFLSGGIDSSSVVALMGKILDKPVRTFSIRFTGAEKEFEWFDDASFASKVATQFQTEHTEEIVTGQDVWANLLDSVWAMDQPSGDAIQYYLLSKCARQGVTVALSGTGGDEVFAGYEWFKKIRDSEKFHAWFRWVRPQVAQRMLHWIKLFRKDYHLSAPLRKLETILLGRAGFIERYRLDRRMHRQDDYDYFFCSDLMKRINECDLEAVDPIIRYGTRCAGLDTVARTSYLQLKTDLVNLLIRDQDAVSMANSLEVRVPLLDHLLVETAARVPSELKLRGNEEKFILRQALSHLLPTDITARRKKGFIFPMGSWMRHELKPVINSCLSKEATTRRGVFNPDVAEYLRQGFYAGKQPFFKIWNLAVFELWCRLVLDRKKGWEKPSGTVADYL